MNCMYVDSTHGNDAWTGTLATADHDQKDGPVQSLIRAVEVARRQECKDIRLRGGTHRLTETIRLDRRDCGLTLRSHENEEAVVDGGTVIDGWEQTTVDGVRRWTCDVSGFIDELGRPFHSLYVNGERRNRPRWPKHGFFRVQSVGHERSGKWRGTYQVRLPHDLLPDGWSPLGADLRILHKWVDERMPITAYDAEGRIVTSSCRSVHTVTGETSGWQNERAYLENVSAALCEPGEWCLDADNARLRYLPLDHETLENTQVVAPRLLQLLRIEGDTSNGEPARDIRFEGIRFRHTDWVQPVGDWGYRYDPLLPRDQWAPRDAFDRFIKIEAFDPNCHYATSVQAAHNVPGAVYLSHAHGCRLTRCTIEHVGFHAIDFGDGCQGNTVRDCRLADLGGGGVLLDGGNDLSDTRRHTRANVIADNTIAGTGRVFLQACGITVCHGAANQIVGNDISDLRYTGISVGWEWSRGRHVSCENLVAYNHIHQIRGEDVLSDLGGIYVLGVQPGTVLRGNHIHHIDRDAYGGAGIYLDAATANVVVEDNLIHDVRDHGVLLNEDNCENRCCRNVIAYAGQAAIGVLRQTPDFVEKFGDIGLAGTFLNNVFLTDEGVVFHFNIDADDAPLGEVAAICRSEANLFWDESTAAAPRLAVGQDRKPLLTLDQWRDLGQDRHTLIASPGFVDAASRDFQPLPASPTAPLLTHAPWHPAAHRKPYPRVHRPNSQSHDSAGAQANQAVPANTP